jgi:hypothetical protein
MSPSREWVRARAQFPVPVPVPVPVLRRASPSPRRLPSVLLNMPTSSTRTPPRRRQMLQIHDALHLARQHHHGRRTQRPVRGRRRVLGLAVHALHLAPQLDPAPRMQTHPAGLPFSSAEAAGGVAKGNGVDTRTVARHRHGRRRRFDLPDLLSLLFLLGCRPRQSLNMGTSARPRLRHFPLRRT